MNVSKGVKHRNILVVSTYIEINYVFDGAFSCIVILMMNDNERA